MISLLNQIDTEYIHQLSSKDFKWCEGYRYDFYIIKYNCIIEINGNQHYSDHTSFNTKNKSGLFIQETDKIKMELAIKNNINYMAIDCSNSSKDFIKNSISKSDITKYIDLSLIDWDKCDLFATSNLIYEICNYYNSSNNSFTLKEMSAYFKLHYATISKYLNKGNELGLCKFDKSKLKSVTSNKLKAMFSKSVDVYKDGKYINTFESVTGLSKISKELFGEYFDIGSISEVCNGKKHQCKGYQFKYFGQPMLCNRPNTLCKKIEMFKDDNSIGIYESARYLSKHSIELYGIDLKACSIYDVCNNKRYLYKGFHFKYII